jgi:hypothetical protein
MTLSQLGAEFWAAKATWSIREAACLVNDVDPTDSTIKILPKSISPVSKIFYWLQKEIEHGHLTKVAVSDDEPRFSPGTIMRSLKERGPGTILGSQRKKGWDVPKSLETAYNNHGKVKGPHKLNLEGILIYRRAAELGWRICPEMTKETMAKRLFDLPHHCENYKLPTVKVATIRKYLKGIGSTKAGRPRKGTQAAAAIDLAEIAKKI